MARSLKQGPLVTLKSLSPMLLYRLRMMNRAEFHALPFVSEGVENRLAQAAHTAVSLESLLSECHTKRYPLSRIKRLLCCALLHITQEDVRAANEQGPCYLHLLALNPQNAVMRSAVKAASLPVCTGGADLSSFPSFAMDARATRPVCPLLRPGGRLGLYRAGLHLRLAVNQLVLSRPSSPSSFRPPICAHSLLFSTSNWLIYPTGGEINTSASVN